jgi:hypothetical protein
MQTQAGASPLVEAARICPELPQGKLIKKWYRSLKQIYHFHIPSVARLMDFNWQAIALPLYFS